MKTATTGVGKKRSVKRIITWIAGVFLLILSGVGVFLYYNFNQLLSGSLKESFNSNLISDVYELKFEKLSVNFLTGNISVHNVNLQPREKPLHDYPYINSSFHLKADKILLGDVQISTLLRSNVLKLERIELTAPGIDFTIADTKPVFFPFKDTVGVAGNQQGNKKSIESFFLEEFKMIDASFHVANSAKKREFNIQQINIFLKGLMIDQNPGKDIISYNHVDFSIGKLQGDMQKGPFKHISFKDYKLSIDSLQVQHSYDTTIFRFANFRTGVNDLDIQTTDSIYHFSMQALNLSYIDKLIKLSKVSFKPNVSETAIQAGFAFQQTQFSGTMGSIQLTGVNFDSLIWARKLLIDQILLDDVSASIFKDNSKPIDENKFPQYLGQSIRAIPIPLAVEKVKVTRLNLVNREKKPDGGYGIANIQRGTVNITHITNLSFGEPLAIKADAYIENKAHFNLTLHFSYLEKKFTFDAIVERFNLTELNPLIKSYTPANVNKGTLDRMTFSGNAFHRDASGTMTFLYHDLDINLAIKEKAKWKSSVLTFAANTALPAANPSSADKPARVVQFHVDRNMNKSFVNLVIKSLLTGLKETMLMSKENKQAYKKEKKIARQENKEEKKKAKQERKEEKKKAKEESRKNKN